jgi:hypothetical protein
LSCKKYSLGREDKGQQNPKIRNHGQVIEPISQALEEYSESKERKNILYDFTLLEISYWHTCSNALAIDDGGWWVARTAETAEPPRLAAAHVRPNASPGVAAGRAA